MGAESFYDPISRDAILEARSRLTRAGVTVDDWSKANGFERKTVYNVLSGRRAAVRGISLRIAIALGLRPDPANPGAHDGLPLNSNPAERTVAGGPSVQHRNRRPISQSPVLGEAVR